MLARKSVKFKNIHQPSMGNNNNNNSSVSQQSQTKSGCNKGKAHIVVPYIQGLSESSKKVCIEHGVKVYFKGVQIIKGLLVAPIDKSVITKSGMIYRCRHGIEDCDEEYIGEPS